MRKISEFITQYIDFETQKDAEKYVNKLTKKQHNDLHFRVVSYDIYKIEEYNKDNEKYNYCLKIEIDKDFLN